MFILADPSNFSTPCLVCQEMQYRRTAEYIAILRVSTYTYSILFLLQSHVYAHHPVLPPLPHKRHRLNKDSRILFALSYVVLPQHSLPSRLHSVVLELPKASHFITPFASPSEKPKRLTDSGYIEN